MTDDLAHLDRPDAVIFDLDGTLVDTVPARIAGWAEVLAAEGIEIHAHQIAPMIGIDGRRLAREAAAADGRSLDDDDAERIDHAAGARFDVHNASPKALPGARETLDRLDRSAMTWAIATSSRAAQVRGSVAALGLSRDPRIVDGSRVAHAKPAPDLLLLAAEEIGVEPSRTWYVGDATWDMRAAAAAGMVPIAVLAGSAVDADALRDAGASVVLDTLDGLRLPD